MNMKKISVFFAAIFIFASSVFAQQITRFGVVDTARVYQAYFRNSSPVRNYEAKKAEFQNEINRRTEEIRNLKSQKVDYQKNNNTSAAERLEAEITRKTDLLTEYTSTKNVELESLKKNLQNSDSFYKKLYGILEKVAENEGFSMILSLQQANAILWYSPSVDITEKVINELGM
ncbi:OmpH family outer membrane protein [Treponema pectinovorum]|uniref:OmpH family outer membrane protein n=2 Tax=Treponema pectinovorum TaxID=164 RepID=UPI0011CB23CA|nr:OmpH family outer membrane protein [Treponema pectinovorum]